MIQSVWQKSEKKHLQSNSSKTLIIHKVMKLQKGSKSQPRKHLKLMGILSTNFIPTRVAIVKKFNNQKLRDDVNNGKTLGPVKCISEKSASGKNYFNLIDA